jgi:hypothetical protein
MWIICNEAMNIHASNLPFAFCLEQFRSRCTNMYFVGFPIALHPCRGIDRLQQPNMDIENEVERAIITGIYRHIAVYKQEYF